MTLSASKNGRQVKVTMNFGMADHGLTTYVSEFPGHARNFANDLLRLCDEVDAELEAENASLSST